MKAAVIISMIMPTVWLMDRNDLTSIAFEKFPDNKEVDRE
jgi:hypothetical protein